MAEGNKTSVDHKSNTQIPQPLEFQDQHSRSLNMPNDHSRMSPAEIYIVQQSQAFHFDGSLVTTSMASHAEKMNDWREKQVQRVYEQTPHQYRYSTRSSSTNQSTFHRNKDSVDTHQVRSSKRK